MKSRRSRRMISGLLLLWLGLLQFPLPFAVRAGGAHESEKDLSTPFPCMNRPCGCRSAEECWTSCCCTTKDERIAFVIEHGLEMPAALQTPGDADEQPRSCCVSHARSCCESEATSSGAACESEPGAANPPRSSRTVVLASALKCKGLNSLLLQFAGAVLRTPSMEPTDQPPAFEATRPGDDLLTGVTLAPPSPPPRIAR